MNTNQLRSEILKVFKLSLNPNSKWYQQDLKDFTSILKTRTEKELQQQLANMRGIVGLDPEVNKLCALEEKRMEKAGMYNLGNMKPENALD